MCSCFPGELRENALNSYATPGRTGSSNVWGIARGAEVKINIPDQANNVQGIPLPNEEGRRESEDEARKIRRLQMMMSMVMSVIGQDSSLTLEEASELAAGAKRAALAMFPEKELAYDLLYKPRLQRLMRERFRLQ